MKKTKRTEPKEHQNRPKERQNQPKESQQGKLTKEQTGNILNSPKGSFFQELRKTDPEEKLPFGFFEWIIKARARKTGRPKFFQEWQRLAKTERVLKKVLSGEPKAKYHIANQIPDNKQEIQKMLTDTSRKLQQMENSL